MVASAQGEDRSNWNPVTTWAGYDFGFAKATEGTTFQDSTFAANWADLKAQGLVRGAYHFFHPGEDPAAQAAFFLAFVKAHGLGAGDILVVDSELWSGVAKDKLAALHVSRATYHSDADLALGAGAVDSATKAFLDAVKAGAPEGVILMTYTDLSIAATMSETAAAYPLFWPAWPSATAPTSLGAFSHWDFWQWGVVGNVDKDAFNGTVDDLHAWVVAHGGVVPSPSPTPPPPPAPAPPPPPQPAPSPVPPAHRNIFTPIADDGSFGYHTIKAQQFVDFDGIVADCDGIFGYYSKKAMQKHLGVLQDAIIGPITVKALQKRVGAYEDGVWGYYTTLSLQRALNAGTY